MTKPFNSPLETGIRSLVILTAMYPKALDLQHLVEFDYLIVHSGDVDGPESLHAPLPMRSGELLVRRGLIERGLLLMMSRGLIERVISTDGFLYMASDAANAFLSLLTSPYILKLQDRACWISERFGNSSLDELQQIQKQFFERWTTQFQPLEMPRRNGT